MSCKYCFQNDHTIEQCKTILCRVCKEIGHPHWLCVKDKKMVKKPMIPSKTSPTSPTSPKEPNRNLSYSEKVSKPTIISNESLSKKVVEVKRIVKTDSVSETKRDIQFYMKQSNRKWSEIL